MKGHGLRHRVGYALAGWRAAWRREASFRTQASVAVVALVALLILRPAAIWWALVILVVALILAFELINSALETVIDLLHPAVHPEIKVAKDMAAGAVLVLSTASLLVGAALLVDRVPALLSQWGWSR